MPAGTTAPPPDLRVGPYRLVTRLGEGGMGVVHLGEDDAGHRVAVKVLRPHVVGDDEARARLGREVNSLSRVRSSQVAEIVDADPWGPIPYVATRYVPGVNLHRYVEEEGPVTGEDLLVFAQDLAEALRAVHRVGVLHRDIKPSNVVMEGRHPVLIDFGLARVADDDRLTRTGWLLGTPGYLAPEILYGHEPAAAADVHSWAATVAFAGTGRPPFGKGPAMAVMDRVRRGEHDLDGLGFEVLALVDRALSPEPEDRPSLDEVLRALGGEPTVERPRVAPAEPPYTVPYAAAPPTTDPNGQPAAAPDRPSPEPARPTIREPAGPTEAYAEEPRRLGWLERIRRWTLGAGLLAATAALVGAAPYLTAIALGVLVLLLRGLSLTASGHADRRLRRGRKWYDGVLAVCTAPWHFLQSSLASLMLLAWAALLGACVALVLVAAGVELRVMLPVTGAVAALALWTGPGSSRVRSPIYRIGFPIAARPVPWVFAAVLLVALASGLLALVTVEGVSWLPADGSPWRDGTWLGKYLG